MSETPTPYGDPEVYRTTIALMIGVSGRERRIIAMRLGITPPAPDDVVRQWAERLIQAALAEYDTHQNEGLT